MAVHTAMTRSTIHTGNMAVHTVMTVPIIRMPPVPRYTMNIWIINNDCANSREAVLQRAMVLDV